MPLDVHKNPCLVVKRVDVSLGGLSLIPHRIFPEVIPRRFFDFTQTPVVFAMHVGAHLPMSLQQRRLFEMRTLPFMMWSSFMRAHLEFNHDRSASVLDRA